MDRSDQQLIACYLKGDENSLEVLIKQYLKPIYSFVYRYIGNSQEAEDVTQEVFIKVWRNLRKFNRQKSFKTWIFSIAKNTCIDTFKKKKTIPFSEFEDEEGKNVLMETIADPAPLANELLERTDITKILTSAIEKLLPKYRRVLFLRYNDYFTFKEIADVLGEPFQTVRSQHRRALIKLKKLLSN
jgi:RNA polymerase sigma-70 factor (ECF subfamily)